MSSLFKKGLLLSVLAYIAHLPAAKAQPAAIQALHAAFEVLPDTATEPTSGKRLVHIKVTTTGAVAAALSPTVEVVVLPTSTAVAGIDYNWLAMPTVSFATGSTTTTNFLLEILADKIEDSPEFLHLGLVLKPGTLNKASCNCDVTLGANYKLTIKETDEDMPLAALSVGLGTALNVIDKATTGVNVYFDVMAFQLRLAENIPWGGYFRAYQQQGTSSFEEVALSRFQEADLTMPTYTQIGPVRGDSVRVARTYQRSTPKAPTVRSTGAALSIGRNVFHHESPTTRVHVNINGHLEWVRREVSVDYEQVALSKDSIYISLRSLNSPPRLPSGRYQFTDTYLGLDFPILYQFKLGGNSLGFRVVPGAGLAITSLGGLYRQTYYTNVYATVTEFNHGITLGFDTKNVPNIASKNLGFTVFVIKMFNVSKIGDLFKFAEK